MTNRNLALGLLVFLWFGNAQAMLPNLYDGILGGFGHHFPFMMPGYGYGNPYGGLGKYGYGNKGYMSPHYGNYGYKHLSHPYLSADYQGPLVGYGGKMYVPDPHGKHGYGYNREARNTHKIIIQDETKDSDYSSKPHHGIMDNAESQFNYGKHHPHGHIFRKIVEYDFSRAEPHEAEMAATKTDAMVDHHVMKRRSIFNNETDSRSRSAAVKMTKKRSLHDNIMEQVLHEISSSGDQDQPQKRGIYYYPKIIPYVPPVIAPAYYKVPQPIYYMPYRKLHYYPAMGYIGRYRRDTQPTTLTQYQHDAPPTQHDAPLTQQHDVPLTQQHNVALTQQHDVPLTQHNAPPTQHDAVKTGGSEYQHNFRAPQLHAAPHHYPHRTYHLLPVHHTPPHAKSAEPTHTSVQDSHHEPHMPQHEYHAAPAHDYHHVPAPHEYHHQPQYHHYHNPQHFTPVYHHEFHGKAAEPHHYQHEDQHQSGDEAASDHLLAAVNSQPHHHDSGNHHETSPYHHDSGNHHETPPHHQTSPNFETFPHHQTSPNFETYPHHETSPHAHATPQPPVFQEPYYSTVYDDYRKSGDVKVGHKDDHHTHEKTAPTPSDSRMRIFHHLKRPLIHQPHGHLMHSHHF